MNLKSLQYSFVKSLNLEDYKIKFLPCGKKMCSYRLVTKHLPTGRYLYFRVTALTLTCDKGKVKILLGRAL